MATASAFQRGESLIRPADGPPSRLASGFNDVSASAPATLPHVFPLPAKLIRRTLLVTQLQDYRYTDGVNFITTHLRLFPPSVRGMQRLLKQDLRAAPLPYSETESLDKFGNRILEIRQERVKQHLSLAVVFRVETTCACDAQGDITPIGMPDTGALFDNGGYLATTHLTEPDGALQAVLAEFLTIHAVDPQRDALEFAAYLCTFLYIRMTYTSGSTSVSTTAAEAWASRKGVCQDYAHVFLALARLAGLPARYVSGFLPGEGAMHAWVEVLVNTVSGEGAYWYALDPTHNCWVSGRYVSVAVGRDYRDIVPNSGTYHGRASNVLRHRSRVQIENTETQPYQANSGLLAGIA